MFSKILSISYLIKCNVYIDIEFFDKKKRKKNILEFYKFNFFCYNDLIVNL